ncbi:MAG: NAD-dependent epimerase/dehydratase family protein [Bacteroidales bacterium]|jgi:nucleoside-diphosphate-sugar epimerase|nr:NAD-dependent epimerase/dehydratase family protein [Bacteroidales bacterium]
MAEIKLNKKHPLYQEDLSYILETEGLKELHGKSVLITGATGMLGLCLIDALMKFNREKNAHVMVYAVSRSKEKATARLGEYYDNPLFCLLEQDVRTPFPDDLKVDYIIPGASNTHPLAYSKFPIETIEINVLGMMNALNKASQCGAVVLCMSTVEVYGNARGEDVFTEDYTGVLNLSNSRSCYTESKRVCEALCQSYIAERGVSVKIVRLSRIFGPTMLDSDTKASSQFIKKALNNEDIVLKSKGEQFFSYTYVADAVSAILHVLFNGENGVAYNISNSSCNVRLKDFARLCAEYAGKKIVFDLPSESEAKGYSVATKAILDNGRLKALGWNIGFSMDNALRRLFEILTY